MLELRNIGKRFGSFEALKNVSLRVESGEIHGLLGENGAGKTTLMNVAAGILSADQGEVRSGNLILGPDDPRTAAARGIGMVHQHFLLVPSLSVAENLNLGSHGSGLFYDRVKASAEVEGLSAEFGMPLDPLARVGGLPMGIQQRVEILKALKSRPGVLILDEPTAVLTPQESDQLISTMKFLAGSGISIIFISHKHREILAACEKVTVLRAGENAGTIDTKGVTTEVLAGMMMGPEAEMAKSHHASGHPRSVAMLDRPLLRGAPMIQIIDLWVDSDSGGTGLRGVSLEVRPGEITAVVGIEGNGQLDLEEILAGLRPARSGTALLFGLDPKKARRRGGILAYVPGDRETAGLIGEMDIIDNLALAHEGRPVRFMGILDRDAQVRRSRDLISRFDVRCSGLGVRVESLSGGNKQKLVLAREMAPEPPIVVACHPTRGLDLGSTAAVWRRLGESRDRGAAVLVITAEIEEAIENADHLAVIWRGLLFPVPSGAGLLDIGKLMLGGDS